jgi:hypothetical protein
MNNNSQNLKRKMEYQMQQNTDDKTTQRRYITIMEKLINVRIPEGYKFPTSSEEFGTWFCQKAANYFDQLRNIDSYGTTLCQSDIPKYMNQLRIFSELYTFVNEHLFVLKVAVVTTSNEGAVYVLDGLINKSVHLLAQIDEMNLRFEMDGIYFNNSNIENIQNTKNTLKYFYKRMMD